MEKQNKSKRKYSNWYCRGCYGRMRNEFNENPERWIDRRKQEIRQGLKDSYHDTAGPWLDKSVTGLFAIGAIATAVGLF